MRLARSGLAWALCGSVACSDTVRTERTDDASCAAACSDASAPARTDGGGVGGDGAPSALDAGDARDADGADAGSSVDPRDPIELIPTVSPEDLGLPTYPDGAGGDLLISRTGRGCLSVQPQAALSADSAVTLGACRGLPGQRWNVGSGGIALADAPALCLDARGGTFVLSACSGLTPFTLAAADGVIERGGTAADVTSEGVLISYGTHRGENQRWTRLSDDLAFLDANAGHAVRYPLPAGDTLGYQIEEARHRVGLVQPPYPLRAPRDVSVFPGRVGDGAPMISRRVHVDTRFDHEQDYLRVSWPPRSWQSTGVYAPAGAVLALVLPADAEPGLYVRINGHTDALSPTSGNVKDGSFARMPRVSLRVALEPGTNAVRSPYGGELILESERDVGEVVPVEIHGGVELPRFVLGVTSSEEWARRRALEVPWAELEGARSVITVPSAQIADLADPSAVMTRYDRVVELETWLSGLEPDAQSGVHRLYDGKARWVSDLQISGGYGHSGYPIMTTYAWELADAQHGGDDWGVWHELGHNHQQFCLWGTRFGSEVTNNLFSLYVQESFGHPSRIAERYGPLVTRLTAGTVSWDGLDDPFDELVFLMQPVYAFPELGWEIYRRVHRAYRELSETQRTSVCGSSALQVDTFYETLSRASEHDLRDLFTRWGFTLSQAARDRVAQAGLPAPTSDVWRAQP